MSTQPTDLFASGAEATRVLPLENGDRINRVEFERRWQAMPWLKKAELIEGVVHMAAALRADQHGEPHASIMTWLGVYKNHTPGTQVLDNASVRLDLDNEPQPDAALRIHAESGGQSKVTSDGYIAGAPELIAEVAASSSSYDLHEKLNVYRRHGVREYLVWRVLDKAFDWFVLREGQFVPQSVVSGEPLHSQVFPGLWLDVDALLADDTRRVQLVLQQGLETPQHAEFVEQLRGGGDRPSSGDDS